MYFKDKLVHVTVEENKWSSKYRSMGNKDSSLVFQEKFGFSFWFFSRRTDHFPFLNYIHSGIITKWDFGMTGMLRSFKVEA